MARSLLYSLRDERGPVTRQRKYVVVEKLEKKSQNKGVSNVDHESCVFLGASAQRAAVVGVKSGSCESGFLCEWMF
jgi:hypothetical protein